MKQKKIQVEKQILNKSFKNPAQSQEDSCRTNADLLSHASLKKIANLENQNQILEESVKNLQESGMLMKNDEG